MRQLIPAVSMVCCGQATEEAIRKSPGGDWLHLLDRGALASFTVLEGSMMPAVTDTEVVRDLVAFLAGQSVRKEEGAAR